MQQLIQVAEAALADLEADPVTPNSNFGTYANFVNLLDMCGIAVPTAPREEGRPGSVTFLARSGQDALTASVARCFEMDCPRNLGATDHKAEGISFLSNPEKCDRMELTVCGAHMADLPLNWQLTDHNGAFLRPAKTSEHYKFYALADGPPERPGLVRTEGRAFRPITLEIWSLPIDQVGSFLTGIPATLGLGSVELEDGSLVKGFICEASGTAGARDISEFGDWRPYLSSKV